LLFRRPKKLRLTSGEGSTSCAPGDLQRTWRLPGTVHRPGTIPLPRKSAPTKLMPFERGGGVRMPIGSIHWEHQIDEGAVSAPTPGIGKGDCEVEGLSDKDVAGETDRDGRNRSVRWLGLAHKRGKPHCCRQGDEQCAQGPHSGRTQPFPNRLWTLPGAGPRRSGWPRAPCRIDNPVRFWSGRGRRNSIGEHGEEPGQLSKTRVAGCPRTPRTPDPGPNLMGRPPDW